MVDYTMYSATQRIILKIVIFLELTVLIYILCLRGRARGVKTVVTVGIAVELLVLAVAICRLA